MSRGRARPGPATSCDFQAGMPLSEKGVATSIACSSCGAQVPSSTATALEGADYLWHFCGHDCLAHWCEEVERQGTAVQRPRAAGPDARRSMVHEEARILLLLRRDGLEPTIAWVRRTLRIYRAAVLDKNHFAHSDVFRRRFIESYCDFKRWLACVGEQPASFREKQASTGG